ncbi:unnamed protein product [Owenia fusiformis]|uniref:Proteasome subunit beta n=1 Tax=Owenia fusiformis TaxID=6347 RepID=A0A8J1UJD5_OWEFU|nr:unnamed protein product [Owenia fusiformis]
MMETGFWHGGPKPGAFYSLPGNSSTYNDMPRKHTQQPITTGTSVLGVKFDGGIILAADMLGSYGSLARFRNISRLMKVNDQTVLGAGGDYADYQHIKDIIEQRMIDEECLDDGFTYTPKALHSWMTRVMYNRRSQFNPLWNVVVVGGIQDNEPFLGFVDKIGTAFKSDVICTGYGAYIAQPLLREAYEKNNAMSEQEAKALVDRCLKVLFYRDARSFNKYEIAIVTKDGARIEGPMSSDTNWDIATMVKGYE